MRWHGRKKKVFSLFIPENPWYLLLRRCNNCSVWHHQPKGSCRLSGIVCEWRRRLHPCCWILFAGSFLGCQQRFILGSLITRQNGGGSRRDRSFDAVTLFLCHLLTFHYITLQNSSVSPVKCVLLTEPHTRQSISSFLVSAQSHVTCQLQRNLMYVATGLRIFISQPCWRRTATGWFI